MPSSYSHVHTTDSNSNQKTNFQIVTIRILFPLSATELFKYLLLKQIQLLAS